jgi:hypothetical protein
MEYQDFTIEIRSAGEDQFGAAVVDAPCEERPNISFRSPVKKQALQTLLSSADRFGKDGMDTEISLEQVGKQLHDALFHGELADTFDLCRSSLAHGQGLRLRLRFRSDDAEADYLAALPWEWLWDARRSVFLATDPSTVVVRDVITGRPWDTGASREIPVVEAPVRILAVAAAPTTKHSLNLSQEIEQVVEAVKPLMENGQVQLLLLKENSPEILRRALRDESVHILHFMGHGGYDSESGYGAVLFETADKNEDQVDGIALADCLKSLPDLRLVVLNACKTARYAGHLAAPEYSGVASAVVERTGMPAVVAHQHSISDRAAISFSRSFYEQIAAGTSVEEALTELRLEHKRHTPEWGTPVLFLTTRSGKLFSVKPVPGRYTVEVLSGERPEKEPVRLGVRSFVGWGSDMEKRNDDVLDLVEFFDPKSPNGRYILDPKSWQGAIFPKLRKFLLDHYDPQRPLLLDFAAHSSIAFAAGWVLEAKSGMDVRVLQRTSEVGECLWSPNDGSAGEVPLWLDRPDIEVVPDGKNRPDVALSLAVSRPDVADHVEEFIRSKNLPVGRIIDATIAPEPGPRSVRGGAHALRLAQALLSRFQRRYPHERAGSLHLFCAGPNALLFYMGQQSRSLGGIVLYEFPFGAQGSFGRYQRSIELPPPEERQPVPFGW